MKKIKNNIQNQVERTYYFCMDTEREVYIGIVQDGHGVTKVEGTIS